MLSKDFYGKNGFVWWTGVVEDRDDPMKLGSVRVRIIGIHSDDKSLVPTKSLPWAQVIQPTTGAGTTSGPREGDWVFGFFQDGDYAQIPVVLGVFPGIESVQSQTIYRTVQAQRGPSNMPRPSQFDRAVGEATTSRMSRGVLKGTLTEQLNNSLASSCDINEQVKAGIAWARLKNTTIMVAITSALKALTKTKGGDPTGLVKMAIDTLKKIASFLRYIQGILQQVQDWVFVGIEYARMARAVFDYVMSLPARLQAFLRNCLEKVISGIIAVVSELFSTSGLDFGISELTTQFSTTVGELRNTAREFGETVALPGQFIEAIVNPSSLEDQAKADQLLTGFIDSNNQNAEKIHTEVVSVNSTIP